ncbi:hypothetical protein AB835_05215 [Candidatus Endobugula sertula]|uniref:DUF4124 domain-containing protein n=1 Tax=Candidatus Endobugula sertula TaxID=62101 RepID=A0A1D2QRC7_9GAMM|nr:hypothetical protein AB835_05215 [Candidatus Endobugula sertula]
MRVIITILLLTLFNAHIYAQGKTYFRYRNEQGVLVMSDAIPVKYVEKGYEIVDIYGRLYKVVPPEPSQEEKDRLRKKNLEKERLAKRDRELSLRYSHIEDIRAAKKRKLRGIDTNIFTLQLTLNNIAERIKEYQATAAANERQGKEISKETLVAMQQLESNKQLIEEELEQKKLDKQGVAKKYDQDMERFSEIQSTAN